MRHLIGAAVVLAATMGWNIGSSEAFSVKAVTVEDLLTHSSLIVEGRVIRSEARQVKGSRFIQTCAEVEVSDVVKGEPAGNRLELCFLGGQIGATTMEVPGMAYPALGETGIYFIESLNPRQIHPLHGAAQGHFRILPDPAGRGLQVRTAGGQAVARIAASDGPRAPGFSSGVARGISIAKSAQESLSPTEFKQTLRGLLAEQQP